MNRDRHYVIDRIGVPADAETELEARLRGLSEAAGEEIVAIAERGVGVVCYVRADVADALVARLNYTDEPTGEIVADVALGGGRAA